MKQIQRSVKVKINEYAHAWSEFLFVSLLLIFNFFVHFVSFHFIHVFLYLFLCPFFF